MDITIEESKLLQELVHEYDYPDFDPTKHVTAAMLADQLKISHKAACGRLERLFHNDKLKRERIRVAGGYRAWGYYKQEKVV